MLGEDDDWQEIIDVLDDNFEGLFDHDEIETLRMVRQGRRIAWPKQLGDWVTVVVDGQNKQIKCNCERCNRFGKCEWAATLEVIQFRTRPPIDCLTVNDGLEWDMNARKAADNMKKGNIKIE